MKDVFAANGSATDTTDNYNSDGSFQETVVSTAANGALINQNAYALAADGSSYTDTWSNQDGSHGTYSWNASTSDYQAAWYDGVGTNWSDNYQYAAGGSPQSNGYSYTETYASSDGSQGTRQYDAATGLASINWDSAATGSLSGTSTTAVGFVGLQSEGELTNTQPDLNFFNPAASPGFNSFLSAAETHS